MFLFTYFWIMFVTYLLTVPVLLHHVHEVCTAFLRAAVMEIHRAYHTIKRPQKNISVFLSRRYKT